VQKASTLIYSKQSHAVVGFIVGVLGKSSGWGGGSIIENGLNGRGWGYLPVPKKGCHINFINRMPTTGGAGRHSPMPRECAFHASHVPCTPRMNR
jgi:hypothetical protein